MQRTIWVFILLFVSSSVWAQEQNDVPTIDEQQPIDTLVLLQHKDEIVIRSISIKDMKQSPHTATIFAAVVPGLGQIYNKKYWKVPIVYGGIAALCYSIHYNGSRYDMYRRAYRDFINKDPNNKSYAELMANVGANFTVEEAETVLSAWFQTRLKSGKDRFRRYRDLSYFGLAGVYLVQLIDACVDAHFYDFNVDDDISFKWYPSVAPGGTEPYMGASLIITF